MFRVIDLLCANMLVVGDRPPSRTLRRDFEAFVLQLWFCTWQQDRCCLIARYRLVVHPRIYLVQLYVWAGIWEINLVRLVIVLWIVLKDLGLLLIIKIANKIIKPKILPPLLTVNEPLPKKSAPFIDVDKVPSITHYRHTFSQKVVLGTFALWEIEAAVSVSKVCIYRPRQEALAKVNVSSRSVYPFCSSIVRNWNTWASCSGVRWPGWPDCFVGAVVGKS